MNKTDLRDAFFEEVKSDPYAHMITRMCANMWAYGYRQAQRDNNVLEDESFDDIYHNAIEWITHDKKKAEVEAIIAMAQIGSQLNLPKGL
jgi:hypothetical protein